MKRQRPIIAKPRTAWSPPVAAAAPRHRKARPHHKAPPHLDSARRPDLRPGQRCNRQPARGIQTTSLCVLGVVYIGFLFPHLLWIHRGPEGAGWIFFILLVAMLGDTGGYAVGRIWGKRKLLPHISPSKTIEGSVGSIGGNCVAALVAWQYLLPNRSALELVALALLMGVLAQLGDLCESALKRACSAKDSGRLFPGHGGVLDRIDSLLFPGVFIYYYNTLWH